MDKSKIEWLGTVHADGSATAGSTWNPIRARVKTNAVQIAHEKGYRSLFNILTGVKSTIEPRVIPGKTWGYHCEIHSDGCGHCYACTMNGRTLPAWGTGLPYDRRSRDLVDIYLDEDELFKPLKWKRPRRIFPCSMTDWMAEFVPDDFIDKMLAVMSLTPKHTYLCLTKRAERMPRYFADIAFRQEMFGIRAELISGLDRFMRGEEAEVLTGCADDIIPRWTLPLQNVWLGFSAEDQPNFDARWEHMQKLAQARWNVWVSLEPMLGPIDLSDALFVGPEGGWEHSYTRRNWLRYAVVGGESGLRARPMNIDWIPPIIDQCNRGGCNLFVKQLGRRPYANGFTGAPLPYPIKPNSKGQNPEEWPVTFRVRQELPAA